MVNSGKYFSVCTIYPVGANIVRPRPYDFGLPGRTLCAPYGITSQTAIYRCKRLCRLISLSDNLFFPSDWARACPSGGGFAFTAVKATVVETAQRAVSKSHLSNPPPAFHQSKKDIPFGMSFRFGGAEQSLNEHSASLFSTALTADSIGIWIVFLLPEKLNTSRRSSS